MRVKLLFTGGHHNSAIAVIDYITKNCRKEGLVINFAWIGKKHSRNLSGETPEYAEVTKRKIPFYHINAGKLFRTSSIKYVYKVIFNLLLVPVGFARTFVVLLKEKPDWIVSFGGYIALPVVISAWVLRIPSVTHEQTIVMGLANKIIGVFVKKIYVSWPIEYYKVPSILKNKMMYTGLPLRKDVFTKYNVKHFKFENKLPTVYVTGGKLGSLLFNKLLYHSLDDFLPRMNIIWQTGIHQGDYDYDDISKKLKVFFSELKKRVILKKYFLEKYIGSVFAVSDFVLSRGGAHITYELAVLKKPSILIPIPWSSNNEQLLNSENLEKMGLGVVLNQDSLTLEVFKKRVLSFMNNLEHYKVKSKRYDVTLKGQENLGNDIIKQVKSKGD